MFLKNQKGANGIIRRMREDDTEGRKSHDIAPLKLAAVTNLGEREVKMCPVALAALRYDAPQTAGSKHPGAPPWLHQP